MQSTNNAVVSIKGATLTGEIYFHFELERGHGLTPSILAWWRIDNTLWLSNKNAETGSSRLNAKKMSAGPKSFNAIDERSARIVEKRVELL